MAPIAIMRTEVIQSLKAALKQAGGGKLRPAKSKSIELAIKSGFPSELVEFYRDFEPEGWCVPERLLLRFCG